MYPLRPLMYGALSTQQRAEQDEVIHYAASILRHFTR